MVDPIRLINVSLGVTLTIVAPTPTVSVPGTYAVAAPSLAIRVTPPPGVLGVNVTPQGIAAPTLTLTASFGEEAAGPSGSLGDLTYVPSTASFDLDDSVLFTPTITGSPSLWTVMRNPWDTIQAPELTEARASNAYIEVRNGANGQEIEFLQGAFAAGGRNPKTNTFFQKDGVTLWNGVGNSVTLGDRFSFDSAFRGLAEAIWYAGWDDAQNYLDSEGRIIIRVDGDLRGGIYSFTRIGGPDNLSNGPECWWPNSATAGNYNPFPNTATPRPVTGLWIVGAKAPTYGTTAQNVTYPDRVGGISIGEYDGFNNNTDFGVEDVSFQGLALYNQSGGPDGWMGGGGGWDHDGSFGESFPGAGDGKSGWWLSSNETRSGLIRVVDCTCEPDSRLGGDFPWYRCKFGIRMYHSRSSFHLKNVHFKPFQEHPIYIDYINDGRSSSDRRSYFQDITMERSTRTMIQLVSRKQECEVGEPGARGLVLFERCHAYDSGENQPSAFTVVGLRSYGDFPEDGTLIVRNCTHQEGPINLQTHTPRTLLCDQDGGWQKGAFHDDNGFHQTRVVIDGLTSLDINGNPGPFANLDEVMVSLEGVGDIQIYAFNLQNSTGRSIFDFDHFVHENSYTGLTNPHFPLTRPGYGTSNNPPFDTNAYGDDRTAGVFKAYNGSVRFDVSNGLLADYAGWNGTPTDQRFRVNTFVGTFGHLSQAQYEPLHGRISLPDGVTIKGVSTATPGEISGTATSLCPPFEPHHFLQSTTGPGYLVEPVRVGRETFGVRARTFFFGDDPAYAMIGLGVGSSATNITVPIADYPEAFIRARDAGQETWLTKSISDYPTIALSVKKAGYAFPPSSTFETGINLDEMTRLGTQILFKDLMSRSWAFQYVGGGTTPFVPPDPSTTEAWVPLQANGYPDFDHVDFLPGETVVTQIFSISGDLYPAGNYSIFWSPSGPEFDVDFFELSGGVVGDETARSDPANGFRERIITPTNSLVVLIRSGNLTHLEVRGPGTHPDDDPWPGEDIHPLAKKKLQQVVGTGGVLRTMKISGVEYCEAGHWNPGAGQYGTEGKYAGTLFLKGWHSPLEAPYWPHKSLSDPRQSETYNPWYSGMARSGTALELQVKVCNELGRDLWWCVPHDYTSDHWAPALEYIRDNLDSNRKVYLEWSNETWNNGYPVFDYIADATSTTGLFSVAWGQFVAGRLDELFAEARQIFMTIGAPSQLRCCVMGWMSRYDYLTNILSRMSESPDVVGCNGYLRNKPLEDAYDNTVTLDTIFANLEAAIDLYLRGWMEDHRTVANDYSAEFWLYEAGQGLVPRNSGDNNWVPQAAAAQLDQRMRSIYGGLKSMFHAVGVDGVCWYNFCSNTTRAAFENDRNLLWGHLGWMEDFAGSGSSPKWDSIVLDAPIHREGAAPTLALTAPDANATTPNVRIVKAPPAVAFVIDPLEGVEYDHYFDLTDEKPSIALVAPGAGAVTPNRIQLEDYPTVRIDTPSEPYVTVVGWEPQITGQSYSLPDGAAIAHQVCNVFWDGSTATPYHGRPVYIHCPSSNFLAVEPWSSIPLYHYCANLVAEGWTVVSIGATGADATETGGVFDGFDTLLWELWQTWYSAEKDLVTAIKWVRDNLSTVQGNSSNIVGVGGEFASGFYATMLLQDTVGWDNTTSSQGDQSSVPDFVVALEPVAWWPAMDLTTWGRHFVEEGTTYSQATTLADAASADLVTGSPIKYVVDGTGWQGVDTFLAAALTPGSTLFTRDSGTDYPVLADTLQAQASAWHSHMLWSYLRENGYHVDKSDFYVNEDEVLSSPNDWHTGTFSGGIFGASLRASLVAWMDDVGFNVKTPAVPTLALTIDDLWNVDVSIEIDLTDEKPSVALTAPGVGFTVDQLHSPPSGSVSVSAPDLDGQVKTLFRWNTVAFSAADPDGVLVYGDTYHPVGSVSLEIRAPKPFLYSEGQDTYESRMSISNAGAVRMRIT